VAEREAAFWPTEKLIAGFASHELSPLEVTEQVLARIEAFDGQLHSYLTPTPELARAQAREAEARYLSSRGEQALPPLLGVPISVKDLFDVRDVRTSLGSRVFRGTVAHADSAAVSRLRRAGAVFLGKTNTSEFGQSATTENLLGAGCGNPWDPERTSGGSSGGAAASVGAGLATAALGSDAGGSIRIPAALCGLFGLKPTFGLLAGEGPFRAMTDFACSGPIVRRVADARRFLAAVFDLEVGTGDPAARFRIGWCAAPDDLPVDPGVRAAVDRAVGLLDELGHDVHPISLSFDGWMDAFAPLVLSDEWRYRRHLLDEHADQLTDYARRSIEAGGQLGSADLRAARALKAEVRRRVASLFDDYDLIVTPTTACTAFPIGNRPREIDGQRVESLWGPFPFTAPVNVSGSPAASLPVGLADGLPVGLQVIGPERGERALLDFCEQLEAAIEFPSGEMPLRWAGSPGQAS
jgi:Asp-tRNA(Asn)/Glu-tRNA(Gln) amidotransferase A subunit family amidase